MQRRTKILLVIGIILIITVPTVFVIVNILYPPPPKPFNLDDAPTEIREIKQDLNEKLEGGTFSWGDIGNFVTLAQYISDNSPDIADMIEGLDIVAVLNITDAGYLWFVVEEGSVLIDAGQIAPSDLDLIITMNFETFSKILAGTETAFTAFQGGNLDFDGSMNDALKIGRIAQTYSATIMDTDTDIIASSIDLVVTEDNPEFYEEGLTLMPCIEMIVDNGSSTFGIGRVIVYDQDGNIKAQLDDSSHWVHKFINSTTVLMGGAGGSAQLWNYMTGVVQTLPIPGGHHELDYNPKTGTYLVLEDDYSTEQFDGRYILYDILSEYDSSGNLIWQWDGRIEYPFNETIYTGLNLNETFRAGADWMHSNSFVWDKENDIIYLNVRNQDTVLKINKTTNDIVWSAGRYGDFTVHNITGQVVDSIFFHPHSLERIGSNRFIIFDNGFYNPDYPPSMIVGSNDGYSRFVEFEIDESNMTMKEVWSWDPEDTFYYFPDSGGDADRLPNGNTIGIFANKALTNSVEDPVIITEVNRTGDIVWELRVPGVNSTYFWTHRLERFYESPLIKVNNDSLMYDSDERTLTLNLTVWDSFKQDATSSGQVTIIANGMEVYSEPFEFLAHWRATELALSVTDLPASVNYIQVIIENADGLEGKIVLYGELPTTASVMDLVFPLLIGSGIAIPVVILYLWRAGRLNIKRKAIVDRTGQNPITILSN